MHGTNESRPLEVNAEGKLQVAEIFYTIQGEGPYSGLPSVFVRLSGCNLRCHFCDTVWDDKNDPYMDVESIANEINECRGDFPKPKLIVLTGGEPTRQSCGELVQLLVKQGYIIQVETDGLYWKNWMGLTTIVCSPKTKTIHPQVRVNCQHWKYVIRWNECSEEDGLPIAFTQITDPQTATPGEFAILMDKWGAPARPPQRYNVTVWVSPCDEGPGHEDVTKRNIEAVGHIALEYGYRAQVQLHKILELR